jgi:hypothetical protein
LTILVGKTSEKPLQKIKLIWGDIKIDLKKIRNETVG